MGIKLPRDWQEKVALVGLCFPQMWMYVVSRGLVFGGLKFQFSFHGGMVLCLIMIALWAASPLGRCCFRKRGEQLAWLPCVLSVVGMASLPAVGLFGSEGFRGVEIVFGVVSGAGAGMNFALWFGIHSRLPVREALCFILLGFSGGALGCLILSGISALSLPMALVVTALVPAASFAALVRAGSCVRSREMDGAVGLSDTIPARVTRRQVAFLLAQILVYAVVFGNGIVFSVLQNASLEAAHQQAVNSLNYGLRFVFPLLMVAWLLANQKSRYRSLKPVMNAVLLGVAFILLGFWLLGGAETVVAYSMVSVARNLVLILVYMALIKLVHATGKEPLLVFGVGRGVYEASVAAGIAAYAWVKAEYGPFAIEENLVYLTAFCVFMFLTSCLMGTLQGIDDTFDVSRSRIGGEDVEALGSEERSRKSRDESEASEANRREERICDMLREEYQLSERELEIALLFSRGNSKKRIADIVVLSENTVRWHIQQIYIKLHIHSRDELIALIDRVP